MKICLCRLTDGNKRTALVERDGSRGEIDVWRVIVAARDLGGIFVFVFQFLQ